MPSEVDTKKQFADQQSRCEIDKILIAEGRCHRLGEAQLDGCRVCVRHAELLRVENQSEILLGMVFEMDKWLESADGEANQLRVRRVEQQRNEVVEQLRFNRTRIGLIHDEVLRDQHGTT